MNLLLKILVFFFTIQCFSQTGNWEYQKIESAKLISDFNLPYWELVNNVDTLQPKWTESKNKGVELHSITAGNCQKDYHYKQQINNRITSVNYLGDTLSVELQLEERCGIEFGGYLDFKEDTLLLYYTDFKAAKLMCGNCCYSISFNILTDKKFKVFYVNQKQIKESDERFITYKPFLIIEDNDTLGFSDEFGLRNGLYSYETDTSTVSKLFKFDELIELSIKNKSGTTIYENYWLGTDLIENYYDENGTLKKSSILKENFDLITTFYNTKEKKERVIKENGRGEIKRDRRFIIKRRK